MVTSKVGVCVCVHAEEGGVKKTGANEMRQKVGASGTSTLHGCFSLYLCKAVPCIIHAIVTIFNLSYYANLYYESHRLQKLGFPYCPFASR